MSFTGPFTTRPAARHLALLAGMVATLWANAANAAGIGVTYDVSLAGFAIGVASMDARIDGDHYRIDVNAKLTGLAGVLTSGKGGAMASGQLAGARPVPASFSATSASSDLTRTLRMALAAGTVQTVEIEPPLPDWDKPDRVPVREEHKRAIIDPVSALLMPLANPGGPATAVCGRTIPVFDGATRFNIVLSSAGTKSVKKEGYTGPVAVCVARYVPIAGHRPNRSVTKFMEANRDIEAWLAPIAGTNVFVPYRISVKTLIGTAVIEASHIDMEATTAAVPARPGRAKDN